MAETLTGLAPSGTQIRARTPNRRAAKASDWPWLPVEAAMIPRAGSPSSRRDTRLTPPRTLKAPVGWWFSCFTSTSKPTARSRSGWWCSGVGDRWGRMAAAADRTSAKVGVCGASKGDTVSTPGRFGGRGRRLRHAEIGVGADLRRRHAAETEAVERQSRRPVIDGVEEPGEVGHG